MTVLESGMLNSAINNLQIDADSAKNKQELSDFIKLEQDTLNLTFITFQADLYLITTGNHEDFTQKEHFLLIFKLD